VGQAQRIRYRDGCVPAHASDRNAGEPALCFGRLYFREVSGNGVDFGHFFGAGGLVAFSRILSDREVLVVANTGAQRFSGAVLMDRDINATPRRMTIVYSNRDSAGESATRLIPTANFFHADQPVTQGPAAALDVTLEANEVKVFVPV